MNQDQKQQLAAAMERAHAEGWAEWVRTDQDRAALLEGCYFDFAAADRVRQFFAKFLVHTKGSFAGKPFILLDWQWRDVIGPLFGWKRADGTRRYRRGFVEIPKKNGKSSLVAGICLYMLVADGESRPQVYSAASSRQQAAIVYDDCAAMVRKSPLLAKKLKPVDSTKTVTIGLSEGFYRALSKDTNTTDGIDASATVIDELHRIRDRGLVETLEFSGAARDQPFVLFVTTAGDDLESVCGQEYLHAKKVLEGQITDTAYLAVIYEADKEDDWTDPKTWAKANPSFGDILNPEDFAKEAERAKNDPKKRRNFLRLRLNVWVDAEDAFIPAEKWNANANAKAIDAKALAGEPCYGGLDLSSTTDTTAFVLAFPDADDRDHVTLLPFIFLPHDNAHTADRERKDDAPYAAWADEGYIELTPGDVIDYDRVVETIEDAAKRYDLREVHVDPWNAEALSQRLAKLGITVTRVRQGYSLSPAIKELQRLAIKGTLNHGGHPVLRYMVGNAVTTQDHHENLTLNKKKSAGRIDGVVGAAMAINAAFFGTEGRPFVSVYENYDELAEHDPDGESTEAIAQPAFKSVYASETWGNHDD